LLTHHFGWDFLGELAMVITFKKSLKSFGQSLMNEGRILRAEGHTLAEDAKWSRNETLLAQAKRMELEGNMMVNRGYALATGTV
jgi:hypothetical protein